MTIFPLLFLIASLSRGQVYSGPSMALELADLQRGLHGRSMGYLDLGQIQDLAPANHRVHDANGDLEGFQEVRRATVALMGPDSAAVRRVGLIGSWQSGGWVRDLHLVSPSGVHTRESRWMLGVAGAHAEQDWFASAGWVHAEPVEWKGDRGYRLEAGSEAGWAGFRWKRAGLLSVAGPDGPSLFRLSLFPDPSPFAKYERRWFLPQCEASVTWTEAAWNPWSGSRGFGGEVRVPLLGERVGMRLDGGQDGFRLAQIQTNLDPQGNVGLDLSWSDSRLTHGPGVRFRAPLFTFSWNDPEDAAAFGTSRRALVWSLRLVMTWENSLMWYRPGRRPDAGGSL